MKKIFLVLVLAIAFGKANAQSYVPVDLTKVDSIVFSDTIGFVVTDTFVIDLGEVEHWPSHFVKYFKYIGREPGIIVRTWGYEPDFICNWPKEPMFYGEIYAITIHLSNRRGRSDRKVWFDLSNGESVTFYLRSTVTGNESDLDKPTSKSK